jgi:Ca2+:H+ antiporter
MAMNKFTEFFRQQPANFLLLALPFAILAELGGWGELWVFALSSLAIIPLAGLIGASTEGLTVYTGPRLGGLLNATLGNAAELIITIVAIREGLLELVKASITGSILGNILLVMGMSMLLGGLRNGIQRFDPRHASRSAILLMLSVIALLVPSLLSSSIGPTDSVQVEALSLGVAVIMIILYALGLFFSFRDKNNLVAGAITAETSATRHPEHHAEAPAADHPHWSLRTSLIMLTLSTLGVVVMSELLVGVIEPVVAGLGISEFFLGVILIPLIGNVAEHLVAVKVAIQNQMDLSVEIAVASSLQIALFVAPALVFISLIMGNPLQLIFNEFELLALIVGVLIAVLISMDGESNWLEGAELLAVYLILALAFFLLPV